MGDVTSGDPRVRRTQETLQRALIELVEDQELSRISVADVVERAGVSRSTFYDHYRDVHELAEVACTAMIDALIDSMPRPSGDAAHSLRAFFAHLAEHAGLYRSLLGPQGSARVIDHVRRRAMLGSYRGARGITDPSEDVPHDVPAAFTAGALIGVATDWLQRGCPRSPAEMAALTWPLLAALYPDGARPASLHS